MADKLIVMVCRFKRKKHLLYEKGIIINEDTVIIDMKGKVVPSPIYDFTTTCSFGTMIVMEEED